jgi:hypothetical protein
VPRTTQELFSETQTFRLRDFHTLWQNFPEPSAKFEFFYSDTDQQLCNEQPYNSTMATAATLTPLQFRLLPFRSPLLWESRLISFRQGTEMFHFPHFSCLSYLFT